MGKIALSGRIVPAECLFAQEKQKQSKIETQCLHKKALAPLRNLKFEDDSGGDVYSLAWAKAVVSCANSKTVTPLSTDDSK